MIYPEEMLLMEKDNKRKTHVFALILSLFIPLLVGGFSAFLTAEDMKIYETMEKPPLSPPGWLFPIVWTFLYVLMGLASYLIFTSDVSPARKRGALTFYAAQLIMNMLWSTLFFTYGLYLISFIWLLVMWVLILVCVVTFYKIRHAPGVMMLILFLWTTFGAYLNLATYLMQGR